MSEFSQMLVFSVCMGVGWYLEAKHKMSAVGTLVAFVLPAVILIIVEIGID